MTGNETPKTRQCNQNECTLSLLLLVLTDRDETAPAGLGAAVSLNVTDGRGEHKRLQERVCMVGD